MGKLAIKKQVPKKNAIELERSTPAIKKKVHKLRAPMQVEKQKKKISIPQKQKTQEKNKSLLFKDFSKSLATQMALPQNATKGQKVRFQKKQKFVKRKLLDQYLDNQKTQPQSSQAFLLNTLKDDLNKIDEENQNQLVKKQLDKNKGTSPHQRQKLLEQDKLLMKQVFQIKPFQDDPFATIRLHLENTYKQKK